VGVGIWDWDIRTGIVYYSPRWKRLFGYAENEIGEGFEDWTKLLHPDEREWITKFQEDFLAGTSSTITAEYRLRHKDGSYRWIAAHAVVVRDEQGKACRLVGSHGDITERKEAEEKLEAERRALQRMLLASDHDREMVTYEIHDGVAQRLLGALMQFEAYKQIATYESEKLRTTFEAGLQALREASAEARSLMNRTRTPVLAKFGIKAAIADFIDQISEMLNAPEVTYRCEVQFRRLAPTIENAIFRVAQEAIVNAFRHSQSELVRVSLVQDGEEVTLEVQDNGMGFDPASVGASRFGLDGIRERARAFGKDLQLDSTPGQGTRIRVTFPVISPSA
jgi:two-component system sensor histidine kinase UhpB